MTTGLPRVAHGRHGGRQIHQVHHLAAQHVAQAVGVVGQRQFRIFRVDSRTGFPSMCFLLMPVSGPMLRFAAQIAVHVGSRLPAEGRLPAAAREPAGARVFERAVSEGW